LPQDFYLETKNFFGSKKQILVLRKKNLAQITFFWIHMKNKSKTFPWHQKTFSVSEYEKIAKNWD